MSEREREREVEEVVRRPGGRSRAAEEAETAEEFSPAGCLP